MRNVKYVNVKWETIFNFSKIFVIRLNNSPNCFSRELLYLSKQNEASLGLVGKLKSLSAGGFLTARHSLFLFSSNFNKLLLKFPAPRLLATGPEGCMICTWPHRLLIIQRFVLSSFLTTSCHAKCEKSFGTRADEGENELIVWFNANLCVCVGGLC